MYKVEDIINALRNFAPEENSQKWDNSGWQINLGNKFTNKIMLALSVTEYVISQAVERKCDFIISHHPLIFKPLLKITDKVLIDAIQNNIQIYSLHTNFDIAKNGVNDSLCEILNIKNTETFSDFVKVGELENSLNIKQFLDFIKEKLNIECLKTANYDENKEVKKIALVAGSGADFLDVVSSLEDEIDVFLTGDIKYHNVLDFKDFVIVDIGHFESEIQSLKVLKEVIPYKEVVFANEKSPFIFY